MLSNPGKQTSIRIENSALLNPLSVALDGFSIRAKNGKTTPMDRRQLQLLRNHLVSTESIIRLADHYIFLSRDNAAPEIARTVFGKQASDYNAIELFKEQFINAAIVFANSSFDYIQILIMIAYTPFQEAKKLVDRNQINKKLGDAQIDISDWDLAFYSVLHKKFYGQSRTTSWWSINKNKLPVLLIKEYEKLEKNNIRLRQKYQANQLKHYGITSFSKTDKSNILRSDFSFSNIDDFYNNKIKQIIIGGRKNMLIFDETELFLQNYRNQTVKVFNKIVSSIVVNSQK